jgi:hypothetical protein
MLTLSRFLTTTTTTTAITMQTKHKQNTETQTTTTMIVVVLSCVTDSALVRVLSKLDVVVVVKIMSSVVSPGDNGDRSADLLGGDAFVFFVAIGVVGFDSIVGVVVDIG